MNFIDDLKNFDEKYNTIVDNKIPLNQVLLGKFKDKWYLGVHDEDTNPPITEYIDKLLSTSSILNEQAIYRKSQIVSHQKMAFSIGSYFRVCGKIVFNFLAFSHGSAFVLQEKFDPIREWIVKGGENKFVSLLDKTSQNKKIFKEIHFPDQAHIILITKINNQLVGRVNFYGESFGAIVMLCDNFTEPYYIDGYICDWQNKKEYTLEEYLNFRFSE